MEAAVFQGLLLGLLLSDCDRWRMGNWEGTEGNDRLVISTPGYSGDIMMVRQILGIEKKGFL